MGGNSEFGCRRVGVANVEGYGLAGRLRAHHQRDIEQPLRDLRWHNICLSHHVESSNVNISLVKERHTETL